MSKSRAGRHCVRRVRVQRGGALAGLCRVCVAILPAAGHRVAARLTDVPPPYLGLCFFRARGPPLAAALRAARP